MAVMKRTKCVQCGREIRRIPFGLKYMLCKDCYEAPKQVRRGAAVPIDVETNMMEKQISQETEM
jgi:NMD protein affecting ribosome stability and mRNA decay